MLTGHQHTTTLPLGQQHTLHEETECLSSPDKKAIAQSTCAPGNRNTEHKGCKVCDTSPCSHAKTLAEGLLLLQHKHRVGAGQGCSSHCFMGSQSCSMQHDCSQWAGGHTPQLYHGTAYAAHQLITTWLFSHGRSSPHLIAAQAWLETQPSSAGAYRHQLAAPGQNRPQGLTALLGMGRVGRLHPTYPPRHACVPQG